MVVETTEPAVGNTAGDGVRHGACGILGARTVCRTATLYAPIRSRRADQDQGNRPGIYPNDVLILEFGGGGGWGHPAERDPSAVARDVQMAS